MANYQILKADIDEKIYENAQQKITGENLNSILNAMVATLGAEYQFAGVATTATNPGTTDAKVFYIANGKGTYTNFGGINVTEDDVVILYYDTSWHKVATGIASQAKLTELEDELNQIDTIVNGNDILDIVDVGFWNKDLSPNNSSSFKKSKIDVSAFGIIEVNGSARNNAYISLVASDDSTILWQSNNINASFKIDLRGYQQPKYLYYCYEQSVVNNPYVNVLSLFNDIVEHIHFQTGQKLNATKIINNLTTGGVNDVLSAEQGKELNTQLNGSTTIEEVTITADQAGFINLSDGTITNPSSSWKHTILIPIDSFVSATGFINHNRVAGIALYSSDRFDSYLGGFTGLSTNVVITDLSPYTSQYPTARYVAFSTDTSIITFVCKYNNTVEVNGLKNRVELLEGDISIINEDVNGLESKVSSLRKISASNKMLHISFDDTINAFKDLIDNNRASLFDSPFFGALKTLHDTYGCVFSCYCFYDMIDLKYVSKITTISSPSTTTIYYLSKTDESYSAGLYVYRNSTWTAYDNSTMRDDYVLFSLSDMTDAYSGELSNNSDWLKFGFHGIDGLEYLKDITHTPMEIKTAYDNTILDIVRITGTVKSIDMVPRLQGFGGSIDVCRTLRDCDCGCLGFLTSDYSETGSGQGGQSSGYYLTTPAPVVLWNKGQWYDYQERLHFYPSSLRLDGMNASATETYMNKFLSVSKWGQAQMICMYCHENKMFINGSIASNYIAALTKVAEWAIKHDYLFGYPMDRIRMSF